MKAVTFRKPLVIVAALGLLVALATAAAAEPYPRPGATERVSVASDGTESDGLSASPAISADGRYVAFHSDATNLVPGITNGVQDVFVHDRATGATERVSLASDGTESDGDSRGQSISADGRYVAFDSGATNLVPGITNRMRDVFVHDRATRTTERVSVASDGSQATRTPTPSGGAGSVSPSISADGRYVAFTSLATNLNPRATNRNYHIFVHDRATGATELASVHSDGTQGDIPPDVTVGSTSVTVVGGATANSPAITGDGRFVAFSSSFSNLVDDDTNHADDVFVHDREIGTTERVSEASDGAEADDGSFHPDISDDGRYVAFMSSATNLIPGDANDRRDVFVHDRQTGVTERVSVASDGSETSHAAAPLPRMVTGLSGDGRFVSFVSTASSLVDDDTSGAGDVFVHDRQTGVTERVSVPSGGIQGNDGSFLPAISADGRYVAFNSLASNLVPGDTNGTSDVFVRDRGPATGVGGLAAQNAAGELTISGWATFSGATVTAAENPPGNGVGPAGAEVTGASIAHRPERADLLLRLHLTSMPGPRVGGAPGVVYRWTLTVGETPYEVRAMRVAATAVPPTAADSHFALYRCAALCEETARLSGGIGTTGAEVRVSVPLEALGADEGIVLTDIEASTALGETTPGSLVVLDQAALPDAAILAPRVELGIAPTSTPETNVPFFGQADLADGRFSGTLDVSSLPAGVYRLWARACIGEACGAHSVEVSW